MSKRALTKARINYSAKDIEVLEGIDPVRKRPGMYVGSVDKDGLHHLFAEVLDNAMDEVVAGFASLVKINLSKNKIITIQDNGRGIPVDPHPKFKNKSALEVILTTLHTGGKFSEKVYKTAGGLHGVGISVVNAYPITLWSKSRAMVSCGRKNIVEERQKQRLRKKNIMEKNLVLLFHFTLIQKFLKTNLPSCQINYIKQPTQNVSYFLK